MFITDLRKDFFDLLLNERILVVANVDVDSVCAVKILQTLLKCDHVSYTLVPIRGKMDLKRAFVENGAGVKYAVMINCGASIDLMNFLDPPEDLVIFVADSHRPIDVCNVYNDGQVRLLMKEEEEEDIPSYDEVFREESDEEDDGASDEDDENNDFNAVHKKKRFDEASIMKRRDRRLWEQQRTEILFEYQQFSYYGSSTALTMYELAWKMSRDTNDLLWWAIVGQTEQLLMLKREIDKYVIATANLREHVSRLNTSAMSVQSNDSSASSGDIRSVCSMKLAFDKELNLNLYRHWTIYKSMEHTLHTAEKFNMWTLKGKHKLSEFLAELGLPLAQCRQTFSTMDLDLRNEVRSIFEEKAAKYELDDITYSSFTSAFGYRHKFCAADIVYSVLAILEQNNQGDESASNTGTEASKSQGLQPKTRTSTDNFLEALDSLARNRIDVLETGIEKAKSLLTLVMRQVQNFLDLRTIGSTGKFFYAVIQEGSPDSKAFGQPNSLALLAHATLRAYIAVTAGSNKTKREQMGNLPLVISSPLDGDKGFCVLLGIPPVNDRSRKNLLGKAFEQAAKRNIYRYRLDYFDGAMVQMKAEDRSKFFDGLTSLLS